MEKRYLVFDPRSKLLTILFASSLLMFPTSFKFETMFVTLLFILFILNGALKKGVIFYLLFWALVFGDKWLFPYTTNGFILFIDFLLVGNRKMIPIIMAATFAMNRTKISEWIAALKKCHVPFSIIIPLTVLFRFFPTFFQDFKSIRNAMKYRGIAVSTIDLFVHPLKTMEFIIVPILMSAENTSLDLSSAALVRGLSNTTQHTSIYAIQMKIQDYILLFILLFSIFFGRLIS